ncbi:aromatic acid exporter family protein [Acidicapsa dinghuensis]|uniref:Aromatic acid exporter family protein n=1 Tax=Acidicapsa dinghuensis TaxID=2218256 RepID=A0ABW1EGL6_9BACT|nr:FUSC family protein [Acidicapsa dinghuensis]
MSRGIQESWSQDTAALQKRLANPQRFVWLSYEKQTMLLNAGKTALAAGLCYWLATLVHLQDGYWGSISAIIVLQSNVGSTVTASRDRMIGTLIGALVGGAISLLGAGLWLYLLAVILSMVTCSLLGLKNSSRLAGVTVTILMLVHRTGGNWTLPAHRVLEVLLGIVVALVVSTVVFPSRAQHRLRDGLAQEYLQMAPLFEEILREFRGQAVENIDAAWKAVDSGIEADSQLLDAARNEPSLGAASLEGLSMLHHFQIEIADLLKALHIAVRARESLESAESHKYAAQLDPELGNLVVDIGRGFRSLATCVHRWRFQETPEGISLEDDVTALEQKMAQVRPDNFQFPQAEILRAYAVQLHLKQLARLLRTSRLETNHAVGGR